MKQTAVIIVAFILWSAIISIIVSIIIYHDSISTFESNRSYKLYNFGKPKDWYLDSTMTEKRHVYYETQCKMK